MFTKVIFGSQVDIQAAIISDSQLGIQKSFQYYYDIKDIIAGPDINDEYANATMPNITLCPLCESGQTQHRQLATSTLDHLTTTTPPIGLCYPNP